MITNARRIKDYHDACHGIGPLVNTVQDDPTSLLYDLVQEVIALQNRLLAIESHARDTVSLTAGIH